MSATSPIPPPPPETLVTRAESVVSHSPSRWVLLARDHTVQVIAALAVLGNVALFIYLGLRFDALPDLITLHFDSSGLPDRIEAKSSIWGVPTIGSIVLVINTVVGIVLHSRERAATILLLTGALLAQILLWLAVHSIVGGWW
ncbi:MAG: hypothetical protein N2559_03690 [Anaerolineae bacterium]|nr:hypothetical protein [Anaerolineae bacterium]